RIAVLLLVPLIFLAHPLGLVWLAGSSGYALAAERLPRHRIFLFAAATLLAISINSYVLHHYSLYHATTPPYLYNGADQIVLYSHAYKLIALALVSFVLLALANEVATRRHDPEIRGTGAILLQLYL